MFVVQFKNWLKVVDGYDSAVRAAQSVDEDEFEIWEL